MRIAVDVMGADRGPAEIVAGGVAALKKFGDTQVLLVGDQPTIEAALGQHRLPAEARRRLHIRHASQVVEMHDKVDSIRKKQDSSLVRSMEAVRDGGADAVVAVGNTAATVAVSWFTLGRLEGVPRPGIAVPIPTIKNGPPCVVVDMGANTRPQPKHLAVYGLMASRYSERIFGARNPAVGLLNVGEEQGKGNDFLRESYELLSQQPINFVGNVEGNDIFKGEVQVVVCDGFVGNAVLKAIEGSATLLMTVLREELNKGPFVKFGAALCRKAFRTMRARLDYAAYGGAPLLGVKGVCIIGHGKSNAAAVMNAVRVARESVASNLNTVIVESLSAQRAGATVS
ncbi:MAG TPA: phosphate acyltransferase PlsX [Planctomycetota bacterium]|nr:phosphate acyltransferase PlsX [Planctomycetota bacterium]